MFGRRELRGLREKVGEFAAGFDPALVTPTLANAMVEDAAAIEKMAATIKALLAARVADTDIATREGDKSPAHALARKTGTTVGKAADAIRTGKRLAKQPTLDDAARKGKVSAEQAAAISDATEADPAAEERLVDQAGRSTLVELRNECERTKAAADKDAEERRRRILAARFARRRNCPDGSAEIVYRSTIEQVAEMWSVISAYATQAFNLARLEGRHEPAQAYAADGMLAMARAAVLGTWAPTGHSDGASTGAAAHSGNRSTNEGASAPGRESHAGDPGGPFDGDEASRAGEPGDLFGSDPGGQGRGERGPPGPKTKRPSAQCPGLAGSHLPARGLRRHRGARVRPPPRLGGHPHHPAGVDRPPLSPRPRPQDLRRVGPGRGEREATARASRGPPPSPPHKSKPAPVGAGDWSTRLSRRLVGV